MKINYISIKRILFKIFFPDITMDRFCDIQNQYDSSDPVLAKNDYSKSAIRIHNSYRRKLRKYGYRVSQMSWELEKERERSVLERAFLGTEEFDNRFIDEKRFMEENNKLTVFPYEFSLKYDSYTIMSEVDQVNGMQYVRHNNKKLYFPSNENSIEMYRRLLMEQDVKSPHCYFEKSHDVGGDIFVDIGAAEGIISLDVVDKFSQLYLLECDQQWINALKSTFADYDNKVKIIKKYAGSLTKKNEITIDDLLGDVSGRKIYMKMDVEGMELDVLLGAQRTLAQNNCVVSCTTYHTNSSADRLSGFFEKIGYSYEYSNGYMLFYYGYMTLRNGVYEKQRFPYLRHAIIRASSN